MRLSAMNFLAIREHSRLELKNKLKKKFPGCIAEIEQLLSQLETENLLSDQRFTETFVRSRMNKAYGPIKIRYELALKGISNDIIEYNMDLDEESWLECLKKAWNKKFSKVCSKVKADNHQDRIKHSRYLYQRGFSSEQINTFLNNKQHF